MSSDLHFCAPVIGAKNLIPKKHQIEFDMQPGHYQKTVKGLELVMIPHFLHKFCTKIFLINWQSFNITVCLL